MSSLFVFLTERSLGIDTLINVSILPLPTPYLGTWNNYEIN